MRPLLYLLAALSISLSSASAADPRRPNVVLIVIDDLGRNDLACYGSKFYKTPNLDRMASEGLRLTDAYAACPVCSPSRAALMTGKYPARLNLTDWLPGRGDRPDQMLNRPVINQQLPLDEETIAEALRRSGYATGHVGKWHLGGGAFGPLKQGFDFNIGGDERGSPLSYFAPYKTTDRDGKQHVMPGLEVAEPGEYLTDRLTTEAEKFISANKERPFFLYLAHYDVHTPIRAKQSYVEHFPKVEGKLGQQTNRVYAAKVESMDESVGRVLKKLADLKLDQNTIVIFTSDNGGLSVVEGPNTPATINAPLREGKGYLYEGGIRVSCLVRWPGVVKAGTANASPVSSYDLFPTILEITGTKTEARPDGVSIVPVLRGGSLEPRPLFWHYPHYSNQGGMPGAAVRDGDWKLIEFYENGRRELYNVGKEISESQNLIEKQPAIASKLGKQLDAWRTSVNAQMMTPNPAYTPSPQAPDGTITLAAKWAEVHGATLRYEPLPHKNTLGYWMEPADYAEWKFTVSKPGSFIVEALQGCGTGNGGSEVDFNVANQTLKLIVEDTGGFQNFKPRAIGTITLDHPGRYTLTVKPRNKKNVAVMDLRQVTLRPTPSR